MATRTVLSVGQCGADHPRIARILRTHFQAEVIGVHTADEALAILRRQPVDLVLVNRIFDWDGASGLDFIRQLKEDEVLRLIAVMLVSNYEDAQQEAVQRGAVPGFGKAALEQPQTLGRLRKILAEPAVEADDPGKEQ